MTGNRMARVAEEVRRELAEVVQHKLSDPRVSWVSVTQVQVARDFSHATVFVSRLGEPEALSEALEALTKAAPMLRGELARRMHLRKTPELHFEADVGLLHSLRVSEILDDLDIPDADADADGDAGPFSDADTDSETDSPSPDAPGKLGG